MTGDGVERKSVNWKQIPAIDEGGDKVQRYPRAAGWWWWWEGGVDCPCLEAAGFLQEEGEYFSEGSLLLEVTVGGRKDAFFLALRHVVGEEESICLR